jgi:hypothetical protein
VKGWGYWINGYLRVDRTVYLYYAHYKRYSMIHDEFEFYYTNQESIIEGHLDEFVVIKDRQVRGYYKTEEAALHSMIDEELGTFMLHRCQELEAETAHYYNDAVTFA